MKHPIEAIVIGASAGALSALTEILPLLPADYPRPIMVVVHLPADKKSSLVEVVQNKCKIKIAEAEDKIEILPGVVYFAPPDYHLLIEPDKRLSLSSEEPVLHSRPSIDVLFETAADAYGAGLLGIVMTGANNDGAAGLRAIIKAGGRGIVQDPEHAYAKAMPQAALALCPSAQCLSISEITSYLLEKVLQ